MNKKHENTFQKVQLPFSYKGNINNHLNLKANHLLPKRPHSTSISNKLSTRSNSINKKTQPYLINLSNSISKNIKTEHPSSKLNPKLNTTRFPVNKQSFFNGKRSSSLNNSYHKKHSLNDSWLTTKNANNSLVNKYKQRAKTPNMTKINSSKLNVSKLNLNSHSMGASPNIKKSSNINNNSKHINNDIKRVQPKGGFIKRNIFAGFKNKNNKLSHASSLSSSSKQSTTFIIHEDNNSKMISKVNNNNNKYVYSNNNNVNQPIDKETTISSDSGNVTKKTSNLMLSSSGNDNNVIKKEGNHVSYNDNINNTYMNVTNENFELNNKTNQMLPNGHYIKKIKCIHDLSKTGLTGDEKKVNQDNYFIFKNFNNSISNIFMGVCDGHGYYGHEVSGYIRENLPMNLNHLIKAYKISLTDEKDKQRLHETISNAFLSENRNLLNNKMIDSTLSGTTCVSLIYTPEKMTIANIGDSRCILGEELSNGQWKTHELSRDHKPTIPEEAERIRKVGGRIRPMKDDDGTFIGPLRVYMKDKDMPGLAMTRSFGDYYASTAGTISEPEISEYYFNEGDRFLILASDGLFEFISNEDIVNYVKDFYIQDDIVGCCEYLYKESSRRWIKEEEDTIDDITIIVVFFEK